MEVRVANVRKEFDRFPALHDVSLDIRSGELIALLGPSGSGKTTLLRLIAGLERPTRGKVFFGEEDASHKTIQQRNVGFVFQHYALFRHMTVADNIAFGLKVRPAATRPPAAEIRRRALELLDLVQLSGLEDRYPAQLSGGQRQRGALARAMAIEPRVLLLDEPFGALDAQVRRGLRRWLRDFHDATGHTTIFVTHDQEEALALSDKVAILDRGRIVQMGPPAEVYEQPKTRFAAEFLGDTNFLKGTVADGALRLSDGTLIRTGAPLPATGAAAMVAVRPEKMRIVAADGAGDGAENRLSARIDHVIYAGPALTYALTASDGTALKIFAQNSTGAIHAEGSDVSLVWQPAHTIPMEDAA